MQAQVIDFRSRQDVTAEFYAAFVQQRPKRSRDEIWEDLMIVGMISSDDTIIRRALIAELDALGEA